MKNHQVLFSQIKLTLQEHLGIVVQEFEEGNEITIGDTGVWLAVDDRELTVGYDLIHHHFNPEYEDIQLAIDQFFNLLIRKRRITHYFKGPFHFKTKVELLLDDTNIFHFGTSQTWLYPYWKRTTTNVKDYDPLLDQLTLEPEIAALKSRIEKGLNV